MGDSRSAVYDDEEDWDDLKRRADIKSATWKVYSPEARYAKIGFGEHGYTGRRLSLYVKHEMELSNLRSKHNEELAELSKLIELESKYSV